MSVEEYEHHFTKMMRYTPDDTSTDEKKQFWFLHGLHHGLRQILTGSDFKSLRHLVNKAIALETERLGHEDRMRNEKRRGEHEARDQPFQRPRMGQNY